MRYAVGILFATVLFSPIVLRWSIGRTDGGAAPGNAVRLVIVTPHGEPIRREFEEAFSRHHHEKFGQPVDVQYQLIGGGGGAEMRRTLNALRDTEFATRGTYGIDLAWGGGHELFERDLRPHLEGFALSPDLMAAIHPQADLAGLRLFEASNPPLWYGTALSSFGIGYNKDVVRYLGTPEPRSWADLKNPRYHDWLISADPTRSSSAKTIYMVIVERAMADAVEQGRTADEGWADGMGLIRQICSNCRSFNDTANSVLSVISSGDAAAAVMIDFFARSQIEFVGEDRMGYFEPVNATVINPDPIGMIKGAPNREVAKRFVEFVLSEPGQRLFNVKAGLPGGPRLSSLRRLPVRRSVYSDLTGFLDPVNPFEQTTSFNTSRSRTATYPILGELIQVSCMDLLDELKATRQAILASPRAAELDAKLGRFPFDQAEALKRQTRYLDPATSRVEQLELMRQWTDEFRREYQELLKVARASSP